jgi:hypothetical protein
LIGRNKSSNKLNVDTLYINKEGFWSADIRSSGGAPFVYFPTADVSWDVDFALRFVRAVRSIDSDATEFSQTENEENKENEVHEGIAKLKSLEQTGILDRKQKEVEKNNLFKILSKLPFKNYKWKKIKLYRSYYDLYRSNYGSVANITNIEFAIKEAVMINSSSDFNIWFVLLEALVFENDNDATLQKMAVVKVYNNGTYKVHEDNTIIENADGGPNDLIMKNLIVISDNNIIAELPNHPELGYILIKINIQLLKVKQVCTLNQPRVDQYIVRHGSAFRLKNFNAVNGLESVIDDKNRFVLEE